MAARTARRWPQGANMIDAALADDAPEFDAPAAVAPPPGSLAAAARVPAASAAVIASLALAACGGGDSAPAPAPVVAPVVPVVTVSGASAGRVLAQATMGSSAADIARVQSLGYDGWLTEQFGTARATSFWDWLVAAGYRDAANMNSTRGFDPAVWRQLIGGNDQLRQRVGMALLDFLVVGIDGIQSGWNQFTQAAYLDLLWDGAFGNFRNLLGSISTNGAMGLFLTFLGNRKANAATGAVPDENYARELMQLFTIGLYQLNLDGSLKLSGGNPIETYTQDDVSGLARVFTGWTLDSTDNSNPDRYRRPMIVVAANHESGAKTFLGTTIPANTDGATSMKLALDAIFAHPNVAPFVGKQLIQRLVTSNPSAAYIGRVSAVFENNGSGVRGDLRAVVRAILLDGEARDDAGAAAPASFGKLREPVMRLTAWARAFGATSPSDAWAIGDTSSTSTRLAESPGRAQSVFNFFRPGYTPPGSGIATAGLVAPEFQLVNESTTIAYLNYMNSLLVSGAGDFKADYTAILTKATDSQALLDQVNLLLAANQVSGATIATIKTAVDSISSATSAGQLNRVYTAILLVLASPEFIAVK